MPKVKCPECATIVTHADGYDPICPSCGFRGVAPTGRVGTTAGSGFSSPPEAGPVQATAPGTGLAIASLACGIGGFVVGLTAPIAVILGIVALNQRPDAAGRAMAITGIVLGALVTVGFLLILLFFATLFGRL